MELLRLGFPEAVPAELLAVDRTRLPAEALRLLVQLLSLAGDARAAHAVARVVAAPGPLAAGSPRETRPVWEIAYPNAFRTLIEKHCKAARRRAGSAPGADARGERAGSQGALLGGGAGAHPADAGHGARRWRAQLKLKRRPTPRRCSSRTSTSASGRAYLGSLLKQFDGQHSTRWPATTRAPGRSTAGARPGRSAELDEWVEEIPIAETRGYVKRVLRSLQHLPAALSARAAPSVAHGGEAPVGADVPASCEGLGRRAGTLAVAA